MCKLFKEKKEDFENINAKDIADNKTFWMTIKPFLTNTNKCMLIEKNNLITKQSALAKTMKQYFTITTKQLNLKKISRIKEIGIQH